MLKFSNASRVFLSKLCFFAALFIVVVMGAKVSVGQVDAPVFSSTEVNKLLVVKVNTSSINLIAEERINNESFLSICRQFNIDFKQPFKNHTLNPRADVLARIFACNLTQPINTPKLISLLRALGIFEYVEAIAPPEPLHIPNDPLANPINGSQAWILNKISAYSGWSLHKGSSNIVVGIIDTGVDFDHPDLAQNTHTNSFDPVNGIDDDGDGYVDNINGWDFVDNDNDPSPANSTSEAMHGTKVASILSASTNNQEGVAGIAHSCSYMPLRIGFSAGLQAYEAIVYAADHGCQVLNLSWGTASNKSSFQQDVINYAVLTKDVAVVAAAGNENSSRNYYPASYDNVLSVLHLKNNDERAFGATYNYEVDICSPGENIIGIRPNGSYGNIFSGSSFAAPMVAGAVALVRSKFPDLNALQAMELVRINTDDIYQITHNKQYHEKLGTGRLNMFKTLSKTNSHSLRAVQMRCPYNQNLGSISSGDSLCLRFVFKNILDPTPNTTISLSSPSPYITVLANTYNTGPLATGAQFQNGFGVFRVVIDSAAPANARLPIRLGFKTGNFTDYQYFFIEANMPYVRLDNNNLDVTISSNQRFGYHDIGNLQGDGLITQGKQTLYGASLIIGQSALKTTHSVFSNSFFASVQPPTFVPPLMPGEKRVRQVFNDSITPGAYKLGVRVVQETFAYDYAPYKNIVFTTYTLTRTGSVSIDSLHIGLFADFDLPPLNHNRALWDSLGQFGYVYNTNDPNNLYMGLVPLNPTGQQFFAHDNIVNPTLVQNGNIDFSDGFSQSEKFQAISSGIARTKAGFSTPQGNDVIISVGTKLGSLPVGQTRKAGFAFIAANSIAELRQQAFTAKLRYRELNKSAQPQLSQSEFVFCNKGNFTIKPTNGSGFRFYNHPGLHTQIGFGDSLVVTNLSQSTNYYITKHDNIFESDPVVFKAINQAPNANFTVWPTELFLDADSVLIIRADTYKTQNSYNLYFPNGDTLTTADTSVVLAKTGSQTIQLTVTNANGCQSHQTKCIMVYPVSSTGSFASQANISVFPNPTHHQLTINCGNQAQKAILTNLDGRLLNTLQLSPTQPNTLMLNNVPPGLYFVTVVGTQQGQSVTYKIIKK